MSSNHMLERVTLEWTESTDTSTWTNLKCLEIVCSNNVPKKENIFCFSNYRCLPAVGKCVFFFQCVVSNLCAHSLIPLQLCIPFDPELIKKCKSKLYLINVILCVKAVGG